MNKEWVEQKEREVQCQIDAHVKRMTNIILNCDKIKPNKQRDAVIIVRQFENEPFLTSGQAMKMLHDVLAKDVDITWVRRFVCEELRVEDFLMTRRNRGYYGTYLDSDPVEFDGDIIITDPCYIMKHRDETTMPKWADYMRLPTYKGMTMEQMEEVGYFEDYAKLKEAQRKWDEENPDDWDVCKCGENMSALGIKHYMSRSTIYGDWGCTTFNSDTKEPIGKFCADAGQVAVIDLNEVLEYNPEYNDHIDKPWCVTVIKNFKGTVQFVIEKDNKAYEGFNVRVIGRGVSKNTGEPLNFITSQTGL